MERLTDEELLSVRICDLPVGIEGTWLERMVDRLYEELAEKGIRFRPHVWLAEEWFTPDGVPGIAVPFYLAHPRLMRLERRQMLQVEGGTEIECIRIFRHEAGHAIDNAYWLHRKRRWHETFGSFRARYPETYKPKPNSRSFVLHLPAWYAQAHPAEDFAETFAVWLTPGSRWRKRYEGWPAVKKLEMVDEVLGEIADAPPKNATRKRIEPLPSLRQTLKEHYDKKKQYYDFAWPLDYDRDLKRIFVEAGSLRLQTASSFLREHRLELLEIIGEVTAVHSYSLDQLLRDMINRTTQLKLRVSGSKRLVLTKVVAMLTVRTVNACHSGYYRIAL